MVARIACLASGELTENLLDLGRRQVTEVVALFSLFRPILRGLRKASPNGFLLSHCLWPGVPCGRENVFGRDMQPLGDAALLGQIGKEPRKRDNFGIQTLLR